MCFFNKKEALKFQGFLSFLELCRLGGSREGDDIADVAHTGDEEHQALEAQAEAGVRAAAVAARQTVYGADWYGGTFDPSAYRHIVL